MNRKIYIVGAGHYYANWMQGTIVQTMEEADLVVFTGGEDVDPSLYGEEKHKFTASNPSRDAKEIAAFQKAQELGKHIIGICRGAQFSCVMSEGRLVQHQENPYYVHSIYTNTGKLVDITSTHHQAMYPYNLPANEYSILGWTENMLKYHQNGRGEEMHQDGRVEVEICYFPKTKALGIQGHPEAMDDKKYPETFEYLRGLLNDHLSDKL